MFKCITFWNRDKFAAEELRVTLIKHWLMKL